jgi:hypothetical protein
MHVRNVLVLDALVNEKVAFPFSVVRGTTPLMADFEHNCSHSWLPTLLVSCHEKCIQVRIDRFVEFSHHQNYLEE